MGVLLALWRQVLCLFRVVMWDSLLYIVEENVYKLGLGQRGGSVEKGSRPPSLSSLSSLSLSLQGTNF